MKLKKDFALRQVADTWVVLSFADANINFNGMLTLNETGAMLWQLLEQGYTEDALVNALTTEFDVTKEVAEADVAAFLTKLQQAGCLE